MQSLASRTSTLQRPAGLAGSCRPSSSRPAVVCRVVDEVTRTATTETLPARPRVDIPQWVPEVAHPFLHPPLNFLARRDFKLQETGFYRQYLSVFTENDFITSVTGFKELPEIINGRGAMLGFLAAAVAEIFSGGTVAAQLSAAPRPVLVILGLIVAGSIAPVLRGTSPEQIERLQEEYGIPGKVFTAENEIVHGRLAMVGLGTMLALELLLGHKVL